MHPRWIRARKRCAYLAAGGVTLGVLQGFNLVNFAAFFTSWLSQWLAAIVSLLFGGQLTDTGTLA